MEAEPKLVIEARGLANDLVPIAKNAKLVVQLLRRELRRQQIDGLVDNVHRSFGHDDATRLSVIRVADILRRDLQIQAAILGRIANTIEDAAPGSDILAHLALSESVLCADCREDKSQVQDASPDKTDPNTDAPEGDQ